MSLSNTNFNLVFVAETLESILTANNFVSKSSGLSSSYVNSLEVSVLIYFS